MPMSIQFHDKAIKTLMSPPSPVPPLRDIIRTIRKSSEINALAVMGRDILRSCVIARKYKAPIESDFLESIDNEINDFKLAVVAERSTLLERLKVHEVATEMIDKAQILLAYLGAAFMAPCKESGTNSVHESVNDICSLLLDTDGQSADENNSHEKMSKLPGVTRMPTPGTTRNPTPIKPEYPASMFSSATTSESTRYFDDGTNESFSSGRSPPPMSYVPHYHQSYQPYLHPSTSSHSPMHPSHIQPMHTQPMHSRFSPYATGPIQTGSPISFAQPQPQQPLYQMPPATLQMQPAPQMQPGPQMQPPQPQPQSAFAAQPLGGMPPSYMTGTLPSATGFTPGPTPAIPPVMSAQSQGYISLINELAMKNRRNITWQQAKSGAQHMPEWTMWLYVDGQLRGQGTATTKQAAKELASQTALANLGWAHG